MADDHESVGSIDCEDEALSEKAQGLTEANAKTESRVLRLPLELRAMIYGYQVMEDAPVVITRVLKQPSLLFTRRQIRHGALPICYEGYHFTIQVVGCDATLYRDFWAHLQEVSAKKNAGRDQAIWKDIVVVKLVGQNNWQNLLNWAAMVYLKELPKIVWPLDDTKTAVLRLVMEIASRATLQDDLDGMLRSVIAVDSLAIWRRV
ncbi:hypothetical protein LTR78_010938 [Recurvomyces mirabilis]|uniref:Uncharacterized protein n=1 Tax=Recurvomyces mirabilis TaxID=574656 RepID=A0AAE0TMH5_9PEZI|nr:hypothetical protein LTR78_010938 [Recurvomyces mirabilis]KAK5154997.1 hypothetical protein LTS14_005952 [Recurvomyces mirabilis]